MRVKFVDISPLPTASSLKRSHSVASSLPASKVSSISVSAAASSPVLEIIRRPPHRSPFSTLRQIAEAISLPFSIWQDERKHARINCELDVLAKKYEKSRAGLSSGGVAREFYVRLEKLDNTVLQALSSLFQRVVSLSQVLASLPFDVTFYVLKMELIPFVLVPLRVTAILISNISRRCMLMLPTPSPLRELSINSPEVDEND